MTLQVLADRALFCRRGGAPDAKYAGREVERVTIAEAAAMLGVHPNTVRNRLKAEVYRAGKVVSTEFKEPHRIVAL